MRDCPKLNNDRRDSYPVSFLFDSSKCPRESFALLVAFLVIGPAFWFCDSIDMGRVFSFYDLPPVALEISIG